MDLFQFSVHFFCLSVKAFEILYLIVWIPKKSISLRSVHCLSIFTCFSASSPPLILKFKLIGDKLHYLNLCGVVARLIFCGSCFRIIMYSKDIKSTLC